MDAAWKVLDELSGVDSGVNGAYYSIAADYYKVISPRTISFVVVLDGLHRLKQSMGHITRTRCFTSPASILQRISRRKTG